MFDVIEIREVVEGELFCFRVENVSVLKYIMEGKWYDISERYVKLEIVFLCVFDENLKMIVEFLVFKVENSMFKSFKIMEIIDNCM